MRARASIPAWAKYAVAYAIVAGALVLFIAAPWRRLGGEICAPLRENLEIVRSGHPSRRVSDTFVYESDEGRRPPTMTIERGDFQSNLTLVELRSCLGAGWFEVHARAQGEDTGDAWVFVRSGAPRVLLVQATAGHYANVRWQTIVERPQPASLN
jgi:hypothetical protein